MSSFATRVAAYQARLQAALDRQLPPASESPQTLHTALRYATEGGKRLRPLLVYATGETLGIPPERLDAPALAVELIHAYSLVHDDLPAMDDDDLRRGRPTVHKQFDEATAILVGDGLQALAFEVLAAAPSSNIAMLQTLARASGSRGMVGGQALDLAAEGQTLSLAELETLHRLKTGALIAAAVQMAAAAHPNLAAAEKTALDRYAAAIGLAFQIQDDVLDVEGSSASLGKTAGKDLASQKSTYVSIMGLAVAKSRAQGLFAEAASVLIPFNSRAEPLLWLAQHIEGRSS